MYTLSLNVLFDPLDAPRACVVVTGAMNAVRSKLQLRHCPSPAAMLNGRVLVQIGTYNANLQGNKGLPQNLVDWLSPSLEVSNFLANNRTAPDIVAIGFQELLPLHLGCE